MIFFALLTAYLLGSIPFGLMLTRAAGLGDIRTIGSGNIGATNVMRTGNRKLGVATLLLDASKGFAAVYAAQALGFYDFAALAGLLALLGHVYPVWLRFKGGKGVATVIGVFFALHWMLGAVVCALWLLVFAFTRISSLSSLVAIGWSMIAAYLLCDMPTTFLTLAMAMLVAYTHRANIRRLMDGTELTFGKPAS